MAQFLTPSNLTAAIVLDMAIADPSRADYYTAIASWMETNSIEQPFVGSINSPFDPSGRAYHGREVVIRKGTRVYGVFTKSTKNVFHEPGQRPYVVAGRNYTVAIHHTMTGSIYFDRAKIVVHNPAVCWPGPGSYWREVDINDLSEFNGESN